MELSIPHKKGLSIDFKMTNWILINFRIRNSIFRAG